MTPKIRLPFQGKYLKTQKFGDTLDWYVAAVGYPHNGIDYAMPEGTKLYAVDEGKVSYADYTPDRDGLGMNIRHSWGMSQYWHLSRLYKKTGDSVQKGELLGLSGSTGFATGPHLHFGIKVDGAGSPGMRDWTDPALYFQGDTSEPELPTNKPKTYLVRPGDTLWKISEKFYGSGIYWKKIYDENRDRIKMPGLIHALQLIRIP